MAISEAIFILKNSLLVTLITITPILIIGLLVGLAIAIFQAVTSIQEMTLSYVPKILVSLASLILLGPWMIKVLIVFSINLIKNIPNIIK